MVINRFHTDLMNKKNTRMVKVSEKKNLKH